MKVRGYKRGIPNFAGEPRGLLAKLNAAWVVALAERKLAEISSGDGDIACVAGAYRECPRALEQRSGPFKVTRDHHSVPAWSSTDS